MTTDPLAEAEAARRTGLAAFEAGDYQAAATALNAALALWRAAPDDHALIIADLLRYLGQIAMESGALAESRACFTESLALRRAAHGDQHLDVAASLNNLGILHKETGDFGQAHACHEQALAIRRALCPPDDRLIAASLTNRGATARARGDHASAIADQREALAIWHAGLGPDHDFIAYGQTNLGNALAEIGDFAGAVACHRISLRVRRHTHPPTHPSLANSLHNLGNALIGLGDYDAAFACQHEALAIWRASLGTETPDHAAALDGLGQIQAARGNHQAAQAQHLAALRVRQSILGVDHPETGLSHYALARAARATGDHRTARAALRDALRIASLPGGLGLRHLVLQQFADIEATNGNLNVAIFFGKQAVNLIQRQRQRLDALERALQQRHAAANAATYHLLADLLVRQGRLGEAERVLAMLKEQTLFDLLRRDDAADPRLTFLQLTALESRWQAHGDALIARLADTAAPEALHAAFDDWLDQLAAAFASAGPAEARAIGRLNRAARRAIQADLACHGADTALVHYIIADDRLAILVTSADYQVSRDVAVSRTALHRLVHEFRFAIEQQTEDFHRIALVLHQILITPIADLLAATGITSLLLAPIGALRILPFAALHNGTAFLIERFTLAMHSTIAPAPASNPAAIEAWRVAGFGVARAIPGYAVLGSVRDELTAIIADPAAADQRHGIFPGQIHLDADFTRARLAASLADHSAVHIASHFRFNPAYPPGSHLLLGDGSLLTLLDLQTADFCFERIALVALSACETALVGSALDAPEHGADLEGIAALIHRRGARHVLASLWPVCDEHAPTLMTGFYRAIRTGAPLATALRHAQRAMITNPDPTARTPAYWAAFILLGSAPSARP